MEHIRVMFLLCGCIPRTQVAGSVQLTGHETGSTYTLMCSTVPDSQTIEWYMNDQLVIRTRTGPSNKCRLEHDPNAPYTTYLSERVSARCDASQHNLSLPTTPPVNNGSVWQCGNIQGDKSNFINIGTLVTSTASTTMQTTKPETSTMAVYVAVGAGVGVVIIIVFVVIVVCVRRRKGPYSRAASERDMATDYLAPAPTSCNVGKGLQDNEREVVENDLYEGSADITTSRPLTENDPAVTDVYAEVPKSKKARTAQADKAEYVNMKEL